MKQLFLAVCSAIIFLSGCSKVDNGCSNATVDSERAAMVAFANANNMANAVTHSSGIMYVIDRAGTNPSISSSSRIFITYRGTLLNGTQFDAQTNPANTGWGLNSLIAGWQIGVPLIKKGGKIRLIIPSSLGYGCVGSGATIPSNSPLYFDIEVIDVQ
jgi:FKBP-type peptidyl-prolyl cis-trans isomerase FkpA